MKTFTLALSMVCAPFIHSFAQTIDIKSKDAVVENFNMKGYYVAFDYDVKTMDNAWSKALDKFGKSKKSKGVYVLENVAIPLEPEVVTLYSSADKLNKETSTIWLSVYKNGESKLESCKKFLYEFAYNFLHEQTDAQIADLDKQIEKELANFASVNKSYEKNRATASKLEDEKQKLQASRDKLATSAEKNTQEQKQLKDQIDSKRARNEVDEKLQKKYEKAFAEGSDLAGSILKIDDQLLKNLHSYNENETEKKSLETSLNASKDNLENLRNQKAAKEIYKQNIK